MKNFNTLRKKAVALTMLSGSVLAACASESAPTVARDSTLIGRIDPATFVVPGEAALVTAMISGQQNAHAKASLEIVEHQYPNGRHDPKAPSITPEPMRVDAHVALSGSRSNYLDNDAACDTLHVQDHTTVKRLGAALLSTRNEAPILSWPLVDGEPGEFAYLCFFEGNEPAEGVVLFTDGTSQ